MEKYTITTGKSRKDTVWKQTALTIPEFFDLLKTPKKRSEETLSEYLHMEKTQQDNLKDVGGYVAGTLNGSRRKANAITGRCMLTLDFDSIPANMTDKVIHLVEDLGICFCIYSTRKHRPEAPRLRLIFPANRIMLPDEYEPVARKIAAKIGIEMADPTTFETNRLMYWPSVCADGEFVYKDNRKAPCFHVDDILSEYRDWHDFAEWPVVPGKPIDKPLKTSKQEDPTAKPGIVGAFCRIYDVFRAMDELLPGVYLPCDNDPNRFTYAKGSTTGGAVIYDDGKFLFSHHATDPCSNILVNSFDLVRLHKYADLDENVAEGTPSNKLPSYETMCEYASGLDEVALELFHNRQEQAQADFSEIAPSSAKESAWMKELKVSPGGGYQATRSNYQLVLESDSLLRDRIYYDSFAGQPYGIAPLPWGGRTATINGEEDTLFAWTDADDAGLRGYFERLFKQCNNGKLADAFAEHLQRHSKNPVTNYLKKLSWDGVERLDTLFIDYLGAEDNVYTRTVTRKILTAAVARAFEPGIKFDCMLILCGPQGVGKSTILSTLADAPQCYGLFNDSIRTFEGKEAHELLRGVWLVEIAELNAFKGSDVDRIKQFLTIQADTFRAAYARNTAQKPRTCVFFGTCNSFDFLRDPTGNRRFWPVDVSSGGWTEEKHRKLLEDRDQIWAEARMRYVTGETLYLTGDIEAMARQKQEDHFESDPWEGQIREFIERPIPDGWDSIDVDRRRDYWAGMYQPSMDLKTEKRIRVCANEILRECFMLSAEKIDTRLSKRVNAILHNIGWQRIGSARKFGPYGSQKGYERPTEW